MPQNSDVTVVIPSAKQRCYTVELNGWLRNYTVIVHRNHTGLAAAFNEAVSMADSETVVLMADDLKADPEVQGYFRVRRGEFCMLDTCDFPINGVHVFRAEDFWRVGGFNEQYRYGSVDNEFYCRAVLKGLRYKPIPLSLVKHVRHATRASTVHKLFRVLGDRARFTVAYFRYYPAMVLKHDFLYRLLRGQLLTVLLNITFFFKALIGNKLRTVNKVNKKWLV